LFEAGLVPAFLFWPPGRRGNKAKLDIYASRLCRYSV
jgi:hypothetical protein